MTDTDQLVRIIESAFADAQYPGDDNISQPTYDDEGTSEYFRGRTWKDHSARQLRALDFALTIFTAKAFAYFLPAFMIADIKWPEDADTIPEALHFWLTPDLTASPERAYEIISVLSAAQRIAVRAYFEYARVRDGEISQGEYDGVLKLLEIGINHV